MRWTKPRSVDEAREQLERLGGRAHCLHSGVAVAQAGSTVWRHLDTARLTMRQLSASFIDSYLAGVGDATLASVGAYQVEGIGIQLFEHIEGDFFTILGLPLLPLLSWLRSEKSDPDVTDPVACIVGWPVKHSRSPVIHRFWLRELGIAGDYVVQPVEPARAPAFFADFAGSGYVGANVTAPHKEAAFAAVADMEPAARAIGAVNTLWLDGKRLVGTHTDGLGFLANLDQEAPGWDKNPGAAIVLGAGGGARAVLWALAERGFAPIHLINRTEARADVLARQFGKAVRPAGWEALPMLLPWRVSSSTPRPSAWRVSRRLRSSSHRLPAEALVTDLVYVPLETPLACRSAGSRAYERRWARHAPAPGRARLRTLVRQAAGGDGGAAPRRPRKHGGEVMLGPRPHRLHRHGQVDRRRLLCRARRRDL